MLQTLRTRASLPLLLAALAWSTGTVSTALHFHDIVHAVDSATGQVVHVGSFGHKYGHPGVHDHDEPGGHTCQLVAAADVPDGPEACLHLSGLLHAVSLFATAAHLAVSPLCWDAPTAPIAIIEAAPIELLYLAPKLSPPHSVPA